MNFTPRAAAKLASKLAHDMPTTVDTILCPSFPLLQDVREEVLGSNVKLGAQDMYHEDNGPYTGEVSAEQLKALGVQYVLVGHSERRVYFDETSVMVSKKLKAAVDAKMTPVLLVGDRKVDRRAHREVRYVRRQLRNSLKAVRKCPKMIIAYEPVWAISTFGGGQVDGKEVRRMVGVLRRECERKWSKNTVAKNIRFIYGGSVNPSNVAEMIDGQVVTGAVIGGASLKASSFMQTAGKAAS